MSLGSSLQIGTAAGSYQAMQPRMTQEMSPPASRVLLQALDICRFLGTSLSFLRICFAPGAQAILNLLIILVALWSHERQGSLRRIKSELTKIQILPMIFFQFLPEFCHVLSLAQVHVSAGLRGLLGEQSLPPSHSRIQHRGQPVPAISTT